LFAAAGSASATTHIDVDAIASQRKGTNKKGTLKTLAKGSTLSAAQKSCFRLLQLPSQED
jgi:hypothetical protein